MQAPESAAFYRKTALGKSLIKTEARLRGLLSGEQRSASIVVNIAILGFLEEQGADDQCH